MNLQEKIDEAYPRYYDYEGNITKEQWQEMLQNPSVFYESNIEHLKCIYTFENHAATCKEVSEKLGNTPNHYIGLANALAKRIVKKMEIKKLPTKDDSEADVYWYILFYGQEVKTVYPLRNIDLKKGMALVEKYAQSDDLNIEENQDPYVFIIDEINRGNISKIFGELITLIESTKRLGEDEAATAILPYTSHEFGVPKNVYILGTMNTADRSISLMDTALRRRFHFIEMMPDENILTKLGIGDVEGIDVPKMLRTINDRIEYLYDREHTIGHSYFTSLAKNPTLENLAGIFLNAILPLLQEYFYEDYRKIQLVLGDNAKENPDHKFILDQDIKVREVFKGNPDIDDLPETKYAIQKSAFYQPESYKLIY